MVESSVRNKSKYDIIWVIEILCQKLFGSIPDDLAIEFKPMRVMSAEQEENVKTQKFNRLKIAADSGLIDGKLFADACNNENLLGVQIDGNAIDYMSDDFAKEGEGEPEANKDIAASIEAPKAKADANISKDPPNPVKLFSKEGIKSLIGA
jgi:hypothetical protein